MSTVSRYSRILGMAAVLTWMR